MSDAIANWVPARGGRCRAVCFWCDALTPRTMALRSNGSPSLWDLPVGWSEGCMAPDWVNADGSHGSTFTCRRCRRLGDARKASGLRPLLSPSPARAAAIDLRARNGIPSGRHPAGHGR